MNKATFQKIKSRLLFSECRTLFERLRTVPYALVKGEALSILAYGHPGLRFSADIDLLVPREAIADVTNILNQDGYTTKKISRRDEIIAKAFSHQVTPYYKITPSGLRISIDLNYDILWGEYTGKRIDINMFLDDCQFTDIYGCAIRTLSPIKAAIQLLLHHYKEMNSIVHLALHNSIHYTMFRDVYYLLKNNADTITLRKLTEYAQQYEISPYIYYVLFFTHEVFPDDFLLSYMKAFDTPNGRSLLNCYGLTDKERKVWKYDFATRLSNPNKFQMIYDDLSEADNVKIEQNKSIF